MNRVRRLSAARLLWVVMLFELAACGLLSLRDGAFDPMALLFGAALIAVLLLQYGVMQWLSPHADRFLLVIANFLSAVGAIIQYRLSCEPAFKQLIWLLMGTAAMVACALLMRRQGMFRRLSWPLMLMSLGVLAVLLVIGEESGGAKNWISLGGISVQPSEFVKVALVFVMANHFEAAERTRDWLPSAIFAILCAMLLVAERDLGAALLIIAEVYIVDSYVSYGRGRGFLTGHGYYVHTYGRSNPYYIRQRDKYIATHRSNSGGRSGGCACACACACAGGGRAGCSQKDTYGKQPE